MKKGRWTESESHYLQEQILHKTYTEIAADLDRTVVSVRHKAQRMGLRNKYHRRIRLMEDWVPEMNDIQIGYLAGIMDGEGTISIFRPRYNSKRGWQLRPLAMISGTDPILAEYLRTALGAAIKTRGRAMKNSRPTWQLAWHGFKCYAIVKLLEPHLLVKREQAQIVLEFLESRASRTTYNQDYTEHEISLYERIRGLNRLGLSGWKYEHLLNSSTI